MSNSSMLACSQGGSTCSAKLVFISTGSIGFVRRHPKSQHPPLPISACWPSVNLILVADLTISKRASNRNRVL